MKGPGLCSVGLGAGIVRGDALGIPLADRSVHLGVTSPPYFALRSYQDGGGHYDGQVGSEATPVDFLRALWAVGDEMWRVLDDGASWWINLGDKYAGSGGHNNANLSGDMNGSALPGSTSHMLAKRQGDMARAAAGAGGGVRMPPRMMHRPAHIAGGPPRPASAAEPRNRSLAGMTVAGGASRRQAPDRYNQAADVRAKSLMGLPWRFVMGLICPDRYRAPFEPAACWHDDGPGPCRTCPPRRFPQWIGRAEVIWAKPNGLPESVTDRVRRCHEQWFHVVKAGAYFAAVDEVRDPYSPAAHTPPADSLVWGDDKYPTWGLAGSQSNTSAGKATRTRPNPLGKLAGSVWSISSTPLRVPEHFISTDGEHWRAFDGPTTNPAARRRVRRRLWLLAEQLHADGQALHVATIEHFAAFPLEWPRRIIAGWSPAGICTACGQGRRPVVDKTLDIHHDQVDTRSGWRDTSEPDSNTRDLNARASTPVASTVAAVAGYACACPDTTAPTRPAVVLDPFGGTGTVATVARALGRYGVHLDLSADYNRLARWRIFHSGRGQHARARTDLENQGDLFATTPTPAADHDRCLDDDPGPDRPETNDLLATLDAAGLDELAADGGRRAS